MFCKQHGCFMSLAGYLDDVAFYQCGGNGTGEYHTEEVKQHGREARED